MSSAINRLRDYKCHWVHQGRQRTKMVLELSPDVHQTCEEIWMDVLQFDIAIAIKQHIFQQA